MSMQAAKLTSKGQLTLPKEIREKLGVRPGDVLEFVEEGGEFYIRRRIVVSPFDRYVGYLRDRAGEEPDQLVEDMRGHE
jgi:antitoxin PrlF